MLFIHSVLFRRHSCIRASFHLHVCLPEEGPSSEQLALVWEERCLGSLLQRLALCWSCIEDHYAAVSFHALCVFSFVCSCSDRHTAPHRCGGVLYVYGVLPDLSEMTRMNRSLDTGLNANRNECWRRCTESRLHLRFSTDLRPSFHFCKCLI